MILAKDEFPELPIDIFIDCDKDIIDSTKCYFRNSYDKTIDSFCPITISDNPERLTNEPLNIFENDLIKLKAFICKYREFIVSIYEDTINYDILLKLASIYNDKFSHIEIDFEKYHIYGYIKTTVEELKEYCHYSYIGKNKKFSIVIYKDKIHYNLYNNDTKQIMFDEKFIHIIPHIMKNEKGLYIIGYDENNVYNLYLNETIKLFGKFNNF